VNNKSLNPKQTIWVISELFYPETISTGYIMTEIAKSLSKDFNINVVCATEDIDSLSDNDMEKTILPLNINRVVNSGYNKDKLLSRFFGNLNTSLKMFYFIKKQVPSYGNILLVSNPIFLVWLISLIKIRKKWDVKLIVHDVFPENILAIKKNNIIIKLFYPVVKFSFDAAFSKMNTLILLGRDMQNVIARKINNKVKMVIIENWADTDSIISLPSDQITTKFLFAGNLGRVQGIEILLKAINNVKSSNFQFTFIGAGAMQSSINDYIKIANNKQVELFPWQPREKQNEFLSNYTIGVVTLSPNMYGLGVPSKFCNLLASGKPVLYIGPLNSEIHLVLKEFQIGWYAEAGNLLDITNAIRNIIDTDKKTIEIYSKNARNLAITKYNKYATLIKYNNLFLDENID